MELFLLTLTGAFERKPLIFKKNMDKNKIKFFFKGRNVSQSLFVDSLTKSIEQKLTQGAPSFKIVISNKPHAPDAEGTLYQKRRKKNDVHVDSFPSQYEYKKYLKKRAQLGLRRRARQVKVPSYSEIFDFWDQQSNILDWIRQNVRNTRAYATMYEALKYYIQQKMAGQEPSNKEELLRRVKELFVYPIRTEQFGTIKRSTRERRSAASYFSGNWVKYNDTGKTLENIRARFIHK